MASECPLQQLQLHQQLHQQLEQFQLQQLQQLQLKGWWVQLPWSHRLWLLQLHQSTRISALDMALELEPSLLGKLLGLGEHQSDPLLLANYKDIQSEVGVSTEFLLTVLKGVVQRLII